MTPEMFGIFVVLPVLAGVVVGRWMNGYWFWERWFR